MKWRKKRRIRFFGLFKGTSVAEMEEIVDAIGVDANGAVFGRRKMGDGGG